MGLYMKKRIVLFFTILLMEFFIYGQSNNTVDIKDEVYEVLKAAELQGLCDPLSNIKPYTEAYIVNKLDQILDKLEAIEQNNEAKSNFEKFWQIRQPLIQKDIVNAYKNRYIRNEGLSLKDMDFTIIGEKGDVPVSLTLDFSSETFMSGGIYSNNSNNSFGLDIWENINIFGNLGNSVSYKAYGYVGISKMNLQKLGTYNIGWWWYDDYGDKDSFSRPDHMSDRTINTYRNYSVLPYSYKKFWDGSVYYLNGGLNSNGLTGWPFEAALAMGMQGEIHGSFFNNLLEVGIGRMNREWAAMDTGSSLVYNANAHPFFGVDVSVKPFNWISLSTFTGFLEFPNQNYINGDAWYTTDGEGTKVDNVKDSFFFHNIFAITQLDVDFKYVHWDFGSTVIVPNRFELGYSFPLLDRVLYQNNVGDYDNLALYTDLKLRYPGVGYVWGSLYIDEFNALFTDIFHNTRCMFAYQGGTKVNIPWLPFGTLSFRYTKVEPFCYTHEALDSVTEQPYFSHYISEGYTNNGESLGYYLPPNADEFLVQLEVKPAPAASLSLRYQLIRHGVDWGDKAGEYRGSSIYSELPAGTYGPGRNNIHKYFLHDGAYEWTNIIALEGSYNFNQLKIPIQLYGTIGYVNNWFTDIGSGIPSSSTPYSRFTNDDYKENSGVVISVGLKAFAF